MTHQKALKYTPDDDLHVHKPGMIKLVCANFGSHDVGLPEWGKNSSDEYIRRDFPEEKRVIAFILDHGKGRNTSISCLDFGGMNSKALESSFRHWGDPDAAIRGNDAAFVQGGHGNGGKCYMIRLFNDHSRVVTVRSGKKCVYGVPAGNPQFGYIPNRETGRNVPTDSATEELGAALKELKCDPKRVSPAFAEAVENADGFTLVTGFGPKGYEDGKIDAKDIAEILSEHPQMQRTLELCTVLLINRGKLFATISLPKISPIPGFEEARVIDIPELLTAPRTGKKVSTTDDGKYPQGRLELYTSRVGMRHKKKGRHLVNYRARSGTIAYRPVIEFDVESSYRDKIYGYCTLESLEQYKTNERRNLAPSPLTAAVEAFISEEISAYCEVFEERDSRRYTQKQRHRLDEQTKALDDWKNKILKEMLGTMWGPGDTTVTLLPAGKPARMEVSLSHQLAGVGVSFRPTVKIFDKKNKRIRAPYRWASSDTNVALVDQDLNMLNTFSPGTTFIYAESIDEKLASNQVQLEVVHLRGIQVEPAEVSVPLHGRRSFTAVCELQNGVKTSDVYLEWAEGNPDVARVSSAGNVFGYGIGKTEVAAMDEHAESAPVGVVVVDAEKRGDDKKNPTKGKSGFPLVRVSEVHEDPETGERVQFSPDSPPVCQRPQDVDRNIWWINSAAPFAQLFLNEEDGYGYESPQWRMYFFERMVDTLVQIAMVHGPEADNPVGINDWVMSWGERVAHIQSVALDVMRDFVATGDLPGGS